MTINPESVKAYARELLEAEERGRREVNAELLAACKALRNEVAGLAKGFEAGDAADRILAAAWKRLVANCDAAIRKAERQGEAMEVVGNSHHTGD